MNENVDYWVSKVKWNEKKLDSVHAHKNENNTVGSYTEINRSDILSYISSEKTLKKMKEDYGNI